MDEITLFAIARPDAPEFGPADRAAARRRLLDAAASEAASASAPSRRPRKTRRLVIAAAALAAAAGVLVAVPVIGGGHGTTGPRPTSSTTAGPGGPPATAAAVLLLAARAAATAPRLTARPDQFVYTEQLVRGEIYVQGLADGRVRVVHVPPYLYRTWMSADGQRGMASSQRNLRGGTWSRIGSPESLCEPLQSGPGRDVCYPGYLTGLPRTVRGMLSYLLRSGGPNGPAAYRVLVGIVNTSSASGLLAPNQGYALMYRAAATVPGIELVPRATSMAGRAGIGVAACVPASIDKGSMPGFHGCPERTELIFDTRTYQLIGVSHVSAPGQPATAGRPSTALLGIAVVNKIGQLP